MIPCRFPGCLHDAPNLIRLTAHLVEAHLVAATVALARATEMEQDAMQKAAHGPDAQASRDPGERSAGVGRVAPPTDPTPKETPMATHSRKADPAACKLCARLMKRDGVKCRHHGGPGRSTSNRGRGPKKDQKPAGPMKFTANGSISAHIRGLVQAVAHGKAAEAELTAIRGALGG